MQLFIFLVLTCLRDCALTRVAMSLHESSQLVPEELRVQDVGLSKEGEAQKVSEAQKGPMEEVSTLKASCRGYVGRLGRQYKEIEVLLSDVANYEVVVRKVEILEQIFNSYESKFNKYYSFLEGSAAEDACEKFNAQDTNSVVELQIGSLTLKGECHHLGQK